MFKHILENLHSVGQKRAAHAAAVVAQLQFQAAIDAASLAHRSGVESEKYGTLSKDKKPLTYKERLSRNG